MTVKNLIVKGEFKSGKTSGIIMPMVDDLIKSNRSLLIIDKNYEYYGNYASKLKDEGYEITVLNFDAPLYSDSINLLKIPYKYYKTGDKDKAYQILSNIVETIFPKEVNNDPFWSDAATSLVRGYILKLFDWANEDEINFLSVSRFLDVLEKNDIKEISDFLLKDVNSAAYRDLVTVLSAPYETRTSILSVTRIAINELVNYENRLNVISGDDLSDYFVTSERTVINKKKALFIIPNLEDNKANKLVKMVISLAYQECKKQSWYFILDNMYLLDKMEGFSNMVLSSIYRNIYMIIGVRNISNFTDMYGKEILEVCDIKSTEDLSGTNIDKMNAEIKIVMSSLQIDLPHLTKKELKTFDLLDKMSK